MFDFKLYEGRLHNWKIGNKYTYVDKEQYKMLLNDAISQGFLVKCGLSITDLPYFEVIGRRYV